MEKLRYKLYECGGHVRDQLLGIPSNDIDYSVVVENKFLDKDPLVVYDLLVEDLKEKGYDVFLETPDCFTIRAKFPNSKEVADFVLARKEVSYVEGTRRPKVVLGTLRDDLIRRDFTINAMAREKGTNKFIDLFGGQKDLHDKILRTPTDAAVAFNDDPLRILRAVRFAITKKLSFSDEIIDAIKTFHAENMSVVSVERIREEFHKMFYNDTVETLVFLELFRKWNFSLFLQLFKSKKLWFKPSLEK